MPYRRHRRYNYRIVPAGVGAAIGAASAGYRLGRGAVSRWARKFKRWSKGRPNRRFRHKRAKKFLRSIGITPNKTAVLVHRGNSGHAGPSNANMDETGYFVMNDPRDPCNGEWGATWDKTATGFVHMASMYERYQVLGAKLRLRIKPALLQNMWPTTNGTSTTTTFQSKDIKIGLMLSDNTTMAAEGINSWDTAAMREGVYKTYTHEASNPDRAITLTMKFSLRKWLNTRGGVEAFGDYTGTKTASPAKKVYCLVWMQSADKYSTPKCAAWVFDWTLTFYTKFTDLIAIEDDMEPSAPPT